MYPSEVVFPHRWEARAANEALHNRRKMVAETNRAKHLVKLCEAGMHADALREQLHDSAQDFTDFNHVKDAMVKHDQWVWKPPRSMIKSAEASGADKSKLESSSSSLTVKFLQAITDFSNQSLVPKLATTIRGSAISTALSDSKESS